MQTARYRAECGDPQQGNPCGVEITPEGLVVPQQETDGHAEVHGLQLPE